MDPAEQFQVMRSMRESGMEMLGICHSHPDGPPYPSGTDIRLAVYEDAVTLIVSFAGGGITVRAFRIAAGTVTAVPLRRSEAAELVDLSNPLNLSYSFSIFSGGKHHGNLYDVSSE